MHYAASTHGHVFCIPTYVSWCELNAHPTWFHTYVKTFAISIIYAKIFTFSLHAKKKSIITVVTYANWKHVRRNAEYMNMCGSGIMHMEGVLLAAYVGCQSMYLLTWTREMSTYLRSFFHSSACTLCSLSLLFYYIRPSSILNSPRFHAYCYLPSFCLSHASDHFCWSMIGNQHKRLIERLPYMHYATSTHVHLFRVPTYV
jgi:hypothetical protein